MKILVNFGMAGFGNRIQVLGESIDIAKKFQKYDVKINIKWTDSSWVEGFDKYFYLSDNIQIKSELLYGNIFPTFLSNLKEFPKCLKTHLGGDSKELKELTKNKEFNFDIYDNIFNMRYLSKYSDDIFSYLKLQDWVKYFITEELKKLPNSYNCIHIRNTDKKCNDWKERLKNNSGVIVTDSKIVQEESIKMGYLSFSKIPNDPKRGGIHHAYDNLLESSGMTREDLNLGCILDLFIAGFSNDFIPCKGSSYSDFILRAKNVNWFRRQIE